MELHSPKMTAMRARADQDIAAYGATLDAIIAHHVALAVAHGLGGTDITSLQAVEMLQLFEPKKLAAMLAVAVARLAGEQS